MKSSNSSKYISYYYGIYNRIVKVKTHFYTKKNPISKKQVTTCYYLLPFLLYTLSLARAYRQSSEQVETLYKAI